MISWAYLFVPPSWHVEMSSPPPQDAPLRALRIYLKIAHIDRLLPLFIPNPLHEEEILSLFTRSHDLFPPSTHLQIRPSFPNIPLSPYGFLRFSHGETAFLVGFCPEDLQVLIYLLSGKRPTTFERDLLLEELTHWFQAALTRPPLNLDTIITSLPDHHLQWLLQWMLSQNITSPDMLAAYIWSLDTPGKRLLNNLSHAMRRQIQELLSHYHRERTYRWADEVKYLIHHNLFRHAGSLTSHIRFLSTYVHIRKKQTTENLTTFLRHADSWHASIPYLPPSQKQTILTHIPSRSLSAYGSFLDQDLFLSWWENVISRRGLTILAEDRAWWLTQPIEERAHHAMDFLKRWFALEAESTIQTEDMEAVLATLTEPWQMEIIACEIGLACCLYALKNLPVTPHLLPTLMEHLLEDIRTERIQFSGWNDHRIPHSQRSFLTGVYVLRRLGRLY